MQHLSQNVLLSCDTLLEHGSKTTVSIQAQLVLRMHAFGIKIRLLSVCEVSTNQKPLEAYGPTVKVKVASPHVFPNRECTKFTSKTNIYTRGLL